MKIFSILKAIASGFVWGLGQLFNKQFYKALFFFVIFALFVGIELLTSQYFVQFEENELAYSKVTGEDFDLLIYQTLPLAYRSEFLFDSNFESYESFELYLEEIGVELDADKIPINGTEKNITEENFIKWLAEDLKKTSYERYININTNLEILPSDFVDLDSYELLQTTGTIYLDPETNQYYFSRNIEAEDGSIKKEYVETGVISNIANPEIIENVTGFKEIARNNKIYKYQSKFYLSVTENTKIVNEQGKETVQSRKLFIDLETGDIILEPGSGATLQTSLIGPLYRNADRTIFHHYKVEMMHNGVRQRYLETPFMKVFRRHMAQTYRTPGNLYDDDDYMRLMLKVNFELNPEVKEHFLSSFDHFFYDRAGLFTKGYWAVITLGSTKKIDYESYTTLDKVMAYGTGNENHNDLENTTLNNLVRIRSIITMEGHISTIVLLEGLIAVILSVFFFIFMIWSIVDAYRISERKRKEQLVLTDLKYFKEVWTKGFEYIVLSPALFVLAFISIMPIAYGFIIAFTSIRGSSSMNGTFDWVGLSNFVSLFNFTSGLGDSFSNAFWRVLGWTIIWAVFSTATVFFGGFFQALILNSEKVVFRKFWRTILILPWAIPALLSQMVFSVIFKYNGILNQFLSRVGVYDFLMNLGILGKPYSELEGITKYFYLGESNIQWLDNPFNPTFVRIVLIVINIWLGFPYFMALMTGIMTAIDKTLYEAADIDGATKFQKIRHITMPLMLYSTAPILIMTFSGNFNNFGVIYFITGGGQNAGASRGYAGDTDILISWMYKLTVDYSIYNLASVFSVLIFLFVGSITAWNLSRTKAFQED